MENRDKQNPSTGARSDISKAQSQQQPPTSQDREKDKTGSEFQDNATGQPDEPSSAQAGFGEDGGAAAQRHRRLIARQEADG